MYANSRLSWFGAIDGEQKRDPKDLVIVDHDEGSCCLAFKIPMCFGNTSGLRSWGGQAKSGGWKGDLTEMDVSGNDFASG